MDPLKEPSTHPVPTIIVEVEGPTHCQEEQGIDMHPRFKEASQITEEVGIEGDEPENEETTQNGGQGVSSETDSDEVVSEVIMSVSGLPFTCD
jgi:hypothetical protein